MRLSQSNSDFYIPDSVSIGLALERVTHLGIGAHQDDLEFMAMPAILECFQNDQKWFGGLVCTNGAGSARIGKYAECTDGEMMAIRIHEQKAAAKLGEYAFVAQAAHPSAHAKDARLRKSLVEDIQAVIKASAPDKVYVHNPFDKHQTHIGVLVATVEAILSLPKEKRPQQLIGCEVWRGLDWLPDPLKLVQDVSKHPALSTALNGVFDSQITGGKRYDLAVKGRYLANATFFDSHSVDESQRVSYGIDLTDIILERIPLNAFVDQHLEAFCKEVRANFSEAFCNEKLR